MREHLDDLVSDFSAIHRVGDITSLPGRVFYRMAWRLPHYETVTRAWMVAEQRDQEQQSPRHANVRSSGGRGEDLPRQRNVAATPQAIAADPVLGKLFSFGTGG